MAIKTRAETIHPKDTITLRATFKDDSGTPTDLDLFPTVSIREPSGLVSLAPTSSGVYRLSTGIYGFDYTFGINPNNGVYNDVWRGNVSGFPLEATFNFIVSGTDLPKLNSDGYVALGDDPGFNYTQTAIRNINILLKGLKARLNSSGKAVRTDEHGNTVYIDCDIFSIDTLVTLLCMSLSDFNQTPIFTSFTFEDTPIIELFFDILIRGATIYALASKALIEKGREFTISDNGLSFNPPSVSDLLNSQYGTVLQNYFEQLKYIKNNMRPAPSGLGTWSVSSTNPQYRKLRHLRERRLI